MAKFLALTRKEIASILLSAPILLATAFFVLLDSFAFYINITGESVVYAVFGDMATFMLFTSILIFPLISMHSFADENARGTLETLLTAPISSLTAILAKFSGAMTYVVIYLLHGVVYAVLLAYGGNLDWRVTLSAFLALLMVGALAMSLGIFISSVTVSPAAAAAGTGGVLIFMAVASDIDPYSGGLAHFLNSMSFIPHANRWISGEIDTGGLVYFLSLIAMFLFYAWLSVDARGMDKRSVNPTVRRRMRVTYLLVVLGLAFLLAQAAFLHIKGIWEKDMPLGPNLSRVPWLWLLPAGLSVLFLGWSVLTFRAARRAERGGRRKKRSDKYTTISETRVIGATRYYYEDNLIRNRRRALAALAALIIVLNVNWLANYPFRTFADARVLSFLTWFQPRRWDVSWDGKNSLSSATRRALDGLQGRLRVYNFVPQEAEAKELPVGSEIRRLLQRYADYNGLVVLAQADPDREPELADMLGKEIGMAPADLRETLAVDYLGRRLLVPASSLVTPPDWRAQAAGDTRWVFDGENRLTQAVMRISDPRVPRVLFTIGHRELSLAPLPMQDRSATRFARALSGVNMWVGTHLITAGRPIPQECDILVIASPRVAFQQYEVDAVKRYLDNGGRLLVLGPIAGDEYKTDQDALSELMFSLGGDCRDDVLQDPVNNDEGMAILPKGRTRGAGDETLRFIFPLSRTIRDNPRAAEGGWISERMVESFDTSGSQALAGGSIKPGPFTLIYRSAKTLAGGEARMVLVASGRMASDADVIRGENQALLVALTQWLAGREDPRDIEPRAWVDRRLKLKGPQLRAILWVGVIALPLAWLMAGITAWWLRKE